MGACFAEDFCCAEADARLVLVVVVVRAGRGEIYPDEPPTTAIFWPASFSAKRAIADGRWWVMVILRALRILNASVEMTLSVR